MIINVNNQYNLNILSAEVAHENFLSSPRSIGNWKFEIVNSRLEGEVC